MKKWLFYITVIPLFGLGVVLALLSWLGFVFVKISEVYLNLGSRWEWWCFDEHKDLSQPLNPFNESIKDIFKSDY